MRWEIKYINMNIMGQERDSCDERAQTPFSHAWGINTLGTYACHWANGIFICVWLSKHFSYATVTKRILFMRMVRNLREFKSTIWLSYGIVFYPTYLNHCECSKKFKQKMSNFINKKIYINNWSIGFFLENMKKNKNKKWITFQQITHLFFNSHKSY